MLIDRENAGSVEGGGAAAMDVEERGAEHGKGIDQPFREITHNRTRVSTLSHFQRDIRKKYFTEVTP